MKISTFRRQMNCCLHYNTKAPFSQRLCAHSRAFFFVEQNMFKLLYCIISLDRVFRNVPLVHFLLERQLTIIRPIPPRKKPPKNQPNALLPLLCAMIGHKIIATTVTIIPKLEAISIDAPPYNDTDIIHNWTSIYNVPKVQLSLNNSIANFIPNLNA